MEDRLKYFYERELQHLRSHASQFAKDKRFKEIADRLGLSQTSFVKDPFVDWLLEGSAFLNARMQLLLEQNYPQFSQSLLSVVQPQIVNPTPSMIIAECTPDAQDPSLSEGMTIPRGTVLVAPVVADNDKTKVIYRTGRELSIAPLKVKDVSYIPNSAALDKFGESVSAQARSGIAITLETISAQSIRDIKLDEIDLYIDGDNSFEFQLFFALAHQHLDIGILQQRIRGRETNLTKVECEALGFTDHSTSRADFLLPYSNQSFDGYRLLHEFFALPERYLFLRLSELKRVFSDISEQEVTILFTLPHPLDGASEKTTKNTIKLNCVPAINLFTKSADDIRVAHNVSEHHVLPDRGRPTDYEVHSIRRVIGHEQNGDSYEFIPFFDYSGFGSDQNSGNRYYSVLRRSRVEPEQFDVYNRGQQYQGDLRLRSYRDSDGKNSRGSEVFLSFLDENAAPISEGLIRVSVDVNCTNRHLANWIKSDCTLTFLDDVKCSSAIIVAGPSAPRPAESEGRRLWQHVSHLSLNYLSYTNTEYGIASDAIKQLCEVYAPTNVAKSILEGLLSLTVKTVPGRIPVPSTTKGKVSPVTVGQGIRISLKVHSSNRQTLVLCCVLDKFFSQFTSVNSFTQCVIFDEDNNQIHAFPKRAGSREVL